MSATATGPDRSHAARRWWVVVWLPLLAISAAAVWYVVAVFVPHERSAAIEVWRGRLSAMADDRKAAITAWLDERQSDAKVVAEDLTALYLLSGHRTEPYLFPPEDRPQRNVQRLLDSVQGAYGYRAAYVLDAGGNVVLASTGSPPLEPACRASVARVLSLGHPDVDLHAHADGLPILAITTPVRVADRTVGAVLLSVDPGRWLYPLLLSEPIPTRTGESLLARQVGDQVEFLSPLRHRSAPPLSFRLPFTLPLLAAAAIRGEEGFRSYVDYRGVRVLGAARRIPGTGWGLVVKVDEDEAFSAFRRSVKEVTLAWACVLLALAGVGFGASRTQAASYRAQLGESEARFALLRDHANDAIFFASRAGVILDANRKAEIAYGRRRDELIGTDGAELRAPEERAAAPGQRDALARGELTVFETVHVRRDGTRFPVEVNTHMLKLGEQEVFLSIVRDVTERKRAENALRQSERRFQLLADVAPVGIFETDVHGATVYVNRRWTEISGLSADEALGDGWLRALHPEDRERVVSGWGDATGAGRTSKADYRFLRPDGTLASVEGHASALSDAAGRVTGYVGTIIEITERKRAEETLRESEERYRDLVENSSDLICTHDLNGNFLSANAAALRTTGFQVQDLGRVNLRDLVSPEYRAAVDAYLEVIRREGSAAGVLKVITRSGEARYWEYRNSLRTEGVPTPVVRGIARDITERKRAEAALREAEERFRIASETSNDVVYEWDLKQSVQWFGNIDGMLSYDPGEFPRTLDGWAASVHPDDLEHVMAAVRATLEKQVVYAIEYRVRKKDGTYRWWTARGAAIRTPDGKPVRWAGTITDISERKRAEEEIHRLNAELEERVQQRTAQLEAANKELEAFSYSVSHDLRAPLRAIDGFSRIVLDDYGDQLDDEGKRQLDVIRANTQKMGRLIDDLLAFSRAGRAELHRTRITMSQLVHAAFSEAAPSPAECGRIDLSIGELPDAWADPALMRQVWVNLLSNAVKFSRPRERAVIHVTGALEDARVVYHVSDNGVGFDMRYVQKLFGVFQRLHTSREFEGTGVGLALVQRIVHRHGGVVWAEGAVDSGATFSFALPEEGSHE